MSLSIFLFLPLSAKNDQIYIEDNLGQLNTDDSKSEGEMRSRIGRAKKAFAKRYKLLINKNISLNLD